MTFSLFGAEVRRSFGLTTDDLEATSAYSVSYTRFESLAICDAYQIDVVHAPETVRHDRYGRRSIRRQVHSDHVSRQGHERRNEAWVLQRGSEVSQHESLCVDSSGGPNLMRIAVAEREGQ